MELRIEYIDPDKLTPYEGNAKLHPDEQVEHIANSIREFGFRQPIVVDADNVVVIGHGRLLAAKKLGLEIVPIVRADDLTEAQVKALRLADNKTNESEWDLDLLDDELLSLKDVLNMEDFGFEEDETTERKIKAVSEGNPVLKLPQSKVYFFSVSAFGTESEVILQMQIDKETAEKVIKISKDGRPGDLLTKMKEALDAG